MLTPGAHWSYSFVAENGATHLLGFTEKVAGFPNALLNRTTEFFCSPMKILGRRWEQEEPPWLRTVVTMIITVFPGISFSIVHVGLRYVTLLSMLLLH